MLQGQLLVGVVVLALLVVCFPSSIADDFHLGLEIIEDGLKQLVPSIVPRHQLVLEGDHFTAVLRLDIDDSDQTLLRRLLLFELF